MCVCVIVQCESMFIVPGQRESDTGPLGETLSAAVPIELCRRSLSRVSLDMLCILIPRIGFVPICTDRVAL